MLNSFSQYIDFLPHFTLITEFLVSRVYLYKRAEKVEDKHRMQNNNTKLYLIKEIEFQSGCYVKDLPTFYCVP